MANYNTTFLNGTTEVTGVYEGVNAMTGGLYAGLILLSLFIICFIAMKRYDTDVAFLVTSFITSIAAVFFLVMEWISVTIFVIPVVLLLIAVFYKVANNS